MVAPRRDDELALEERRLFGGAIRLQLPVAFEDASRLREIPDNQEVFIHDKIDQCVMIDLLTYQQDWEGRDAAREHFGQIALCNQSAATVESVAPLSGIAEIEEAYLLIGHQDVSKFNEDAKNQIRIFMALLRLPEYQTDVVITFNDPLFIHPQSSSHSASDAPIDDCHAEKEQRLRAFCQWVRTFRIADPALFANTSD